MAESIEELDLTGAGDPFQVWGEQLLEHPVAALDDIITGRGERGAQQRAEASDFLADLVDQPLWAGERERLLEALDGAVRDWLAARARWEMSRIAAYGTRAHAAHLAAALATAARLPLVRTAYHLVDLQPYWDSRFGALRWPGSLDLRQRYDLVLIQHQQDHRFAPRWFAACDAAAWGSPYWSGDLATGLLGLRKLPHPPGAQPERPVAAALTRFAALALERGMAETTVEAQFRRTSRNLTVLYPRGEEHWQGLWADVLGDLPRVRRRDVRELLEKWLAGLASATKARSGPAARRSPGAAARPTAGEVKDLLARLRRAGRLDDPLWRQVEKLMAHHWADAEATGVGYFAVRTLNNLGHRLLRLRPGRGVLETLHAWTLRAVEVEPENGYTWGFWAAVLDALGLGEQALAVRWEAVRRFPEDVVLRSELAKVLIRAGHKAQAERLLREAIRDFPNDVVCRSTLADLLRQQPGRTAEAEQLLRDTLRDFPDNVVCRNTLADLLRQQPGRTAEAEQLLRDTLRDFPDDVFCRNTLADLLRQQPGRAAEAEQLLRDTLRDFPDDVFCRNTLADLLRQQPGRTAEAEQLLRDTLRDFPDDVVCQVMLADLLQRQPERKQEAEELLHRAQSIAPDNPGVRELAARLWGGIELTGGEIDMAYVKPPLFHLDLSAVAATWGDKAPFDAGSVPEHDTDAEDGTCEYPMEGVLADTHRPAGPQATPSPAVAAELPPGGEPAATPIPEEAERAVHEFLVRLTTRSRWTEAFYSAAGDDGSLRAELLDAVEREDSEQALVAAARVGVDGMDGLLARWLQTHPVSFSDRLLQTYHGGPAGNWDKATLDRLAHDFPAYRCWHDWLRYPWLDRAGRDRVEQEARHTYRLDRKEPITALWSGRLSAVYPGLSRDAALAADPIALRRLVEDIAFAAADTTVPAVALD